jgi:Zn finger protein HypA/HybF involved in hydrogenase expression
MNIYEFSEKNNREMGMLLNVERDTESFMKAFNEVVSIVKNAVRQYEKKAEIKEGIGYCIRCLGEIQNNLLKPLCPSCYKKWSKYGNKLYVENYCHHCGSETKSNISNPLCQSCIS